jgi:hypothetical protein
MTLRAALEHCRVDGAVGMAAGSSKYVLKSRLVHPLGRQGMRIAIGFD